VIRVLVIHRDALEATDWAAQVAKSLRPTFCRGNPGTAFCDGLEPLLLYRFPLLGLFGEPEGNQSQSR
jgi:hypothetical protein